MMLKYDVFANDEEWRRRNQKSYNMAFFYHMALFFVHELKLGLQVYLVL